MCRHTHRVQCFYCAAERQPRRYGLFHFAWDLFLVFLTGGLWLIWIFIREMRNR